jgi:hypothetical protein
LGSGSVRLSRRSGSRSVTLGSRSVRPARDDRRRLTLDETERRAGKRGYVDSPPG